MLPDYTETKRLIGRAFQTYAREKARAISPFAAVQMRYLHEGRAMKIERADKTESSSNTQQLSSVMEVKHEEIPELTFEKVVGKYDQMIDDMVRKQTGFMLDRISEDIPESQSVNAKGRKLDAELLLEAMESVQTDFYPDGRPHELHLIGGLFTAERLKACEEQMQSNPELQARYDAMMAKKLEDWRAREASRKLVG